MQLLMDAPTQYSRQYLLRIASKINDEVIFLMVKSHIWRPLLSNSFQISLLTWNSGTILCHGVPKDHNTQTAVSQFECPSCCFQPAQPLFLSFWWQIKLSDAPPERAHTHTFVLNILFPRPPDVRSVKLSVCGWLAAHLFVKFTSGIFTEVLAFVNVNFAWISKVCSIKSQN